MVAIDSKKKIQSWDKEKNLAAVSKMKHLKYY